MSKVPSARNVPGMMPVPGEKPPARGASRAIVLLGLAGVLALALAGALHAAAPAPERVSEKSAASFGDEFEGSALDRTRWQTQMAWGSTTDGQLERYDPSAVTVSDGKLVLTASTARGDRPYISGVVASFGTHEFTYGYVEMRAKLPRGRGLWPALWLAAVDDSSSNEIDIMEFLGHQTDIVYMTLHYDAPDGQHLDPQATYAGPDFTSGYHTFAVDWRPDAIVWYVDGVERSRQTEGVPSEPMYLIANLGVGGQWPGDPDASTRFPARYLIDYIRVWPAEQR